MTTTLSASVGYGGVNIPKDVEEVRLLIERHMMTNIMFNYELEGGELTMAGSLLPGVGILSSAIHVFQKTVMRKPDSWADGLVARKGQTWTALSGQIGSAYVLPTFVETVAPQVGASLGNVGNFQKFRQGANTARMEHRTDTNGDGVTDKNDAWATIATHGCCLCTLTMAATGIGRPTKYWPAGLLAKDLTPHIANKIVVEGGGYVEAEGLKTDYVPGLFGMKVERYGPRYDHAIGPNALDLIDGHLADGNPVAAHVDYRRGTSKGDHWILITNKNNDPLNGYDAIDPASGTKMKMTKYSAANGREFDFFMKKLNNSNYSYEPGVLYGVPSAAGACSERQRNKQRDYRMVRFLLLSPG